MKHTINHVLKSYLVNHTANYDSKLQRNKILSNDATKYVRGHGSMQEASFKTQILTSKDPGYRVRILQ